MPDPLPTDTAPTLENGLGLSGQDALPPIPAPREIQVVVGTPAACRLLASLDALIDRHADEPVEFTKMGARFEEPLATSSMEFPRPDPNRSLEEDLQRLPISETWQQWWRSRPENERDQDGLELARAMLLPRCDEHWKSTGAIRQVLNKTTLPKLHHRDIIEHILAWLARIQLPAGSVPHLLDIFERTLAESPACWAELDESNREITWFAYTMVRLLRKTHEANPAAWQPEDWARLHGLLRWMRRAGADREQCRPNLDELLGAFNAGALTEAGLVIGLLDPLRLDPTSGWACFPELERLTDRRQGGTPDHPVLRRAIDRIRRRILDLELARGSEPTPASFPARSLDFAGHLNELIELLLGLGDERLTPDYPRERLSRPAVLSHLAAHTFPAPGESPEGCADRLRSAGIPEQRLLDLIMLAPRWAPHAESALGWPMLAQGVLWFHAHAQDTLFPLGKYFPETWQLDALQLARLSNDELLDGAADVEWFREIYAAMGEDRWQKLCQSAEHVAERDESSRPVLYSNAIRGQLKREDLCKRILKRRHHDSVRSLGLLPLEEGDQRKADLLERYAVLQEFLRGNKNLGSQRRANEKRAVEMAMLNLAQLSGYRDELRLRWELEAQSVADLASGSLSITVSEAEIRLQIDDQGRPEVTCLKKGKPLKSIPPAIKKDPQARELLDRSTQLLQQASRNRAFLETAMCLGETFSGAEIRSLCAHPLVAPMLTRLVLVGKESMGYLVDRGRALEDCQGKTEPVSEADQLRIAHPHDLLTSGRWQAWQRECLLRERVQPFKQVFRELYVVTDAERDAALSERYAGSQVIAKQAAGLLGTRGWARDEVSRRVFPSHGIVAYAVFDTPLFGAEAAGFLNVHFTRRSDFDLIPLRNIPATIFSEVMRDLDLVVSVAHLPDSEPASSTSTCEARAALVRETCALLGLDNVRLEDRHALIEGKLAHYSVHLGSGVVHRRPGGMLCIVPAPASKRSRLFLPFADDDPRTAEVLSKILMLAKDDEIKDASILCQIKPDVPPEIAE